MQLPVENYKSEKVIGIGILICFIILFIAVFIINLFNVQIKNLEQVDGDLYAVVTNKGTVNISVEDIIRIEKTSSKSPISGKMIEIDKIYTKEGFIYLSSVDQFSKAGKELINSFKSIQGNIWPRPNITNMSPLQSYLFAIGTPKRLIPYLSFFLSFEYFLLIILGIFLFWLIFPLSSPKELKNINEELKDKENFSSDDKFESLGILAK